MWLINVNSYLLSQFFGSELPKYVILSHTWDGEEVTLQDMLRFKNKNLAHEIESMRGFEKIRYTCEQARRDGIEWAWVDTCCIDKTSSAELTEAINSMYSWYERAEVCYAYFVDVPPGSDFAAPNSAFRNSRWFTRGWTLQELIAPVKLDCYAKDWTYIGRISSASEGQAFASLLEEITGVSRFCLLKWRAPSSYSVAHRLSWAARRHCTRIEDEAYCLMGIFDVNMPLLYGEGKKAFIRLQEEIIRAIDDHSILAWTAPEGDPRVGTISSVLAESPADFGNSALVFSLHDEVGNLSVMTKKGLQMNLYVANSNKFGNKEQRKVTCSVVLNCSNSSPGVLNHRIILLLVQPVLSDDGQPNHTYCRYVTHEHQYSDTDAGYDFVDGQKFKTIYIRKQIPDVELNHYISLGSLYIHHLPTDIAPDRSMCPTNRRGYRITNVDTGTLPDWNAEAIQVKHSSPARVSLHTFLIESSDGNGMEPFVFVCGIKRDAKFFAPQAVFCLLIKSTQPVDGYVRDVAEGRMDPPWVPVRGKPGSLTNAIFSMNDLWVRVELVLENGIEKGASVGKKQTYRALFTFGGYEVVSRIEEEQRRLALNDPKASRGAKLGMLDAHEQKEILARIVAARLRHRQQPPSGFGATWGGRYAGIGSILGPEFMRFR